MRRSPFYMYACFVLLPLVTVCSVAPAVARTWHIGVGGGRVIGYMGTLARYGLPRHRLTDAELTDPKALAQYDLIIVAYPCPSPASAARAIEQYVKDGGFAITEVRVQPSTTALPGRRLGPAAAPNLTFRGYDHPISKPLANTRVLTTYARPGAAIIPAEDAAATVLAAFTDQDVPRKYRGKLTGGKEGIPALVLFKYGKGQWLYCGSALGFTFALRGPELEPWLLATLKYFSEGSLVPRFHTIPATDWLVPTVPLSLPLRPDPVRQPRRGEQPSEPGDDYEVFDLQGDALDSFTLIGDLPAGATANVYLSRFNQNWCQQVEIAGALVSLIEVTNGRKEVVRQVRRPPSPGGKSEVVVRRRPGEVTVFFDGRAVLLAALDALDGKVAAQGLEEVHCQATGAIYFHDDFMRAQGEANPWETPEGAWELHKTEGVPEQGANPFAFRGKAEERAVALAGYWFWDDYDLSASVRSSAPAVGIYAHYQAPDDYLLLHMEYADEPSAPARVSIVRRTPRGQHTLAQARVDCERDQWQRLRLRLSGGNLIATVDGQPVAQLADEHARGWGQIGLHVEHGSALFDDVEVLSWEGLPRPVGAEGPWAWQVDHGKCDSAGPDALRLEPHGFARVISGWSGGYDMVASAQVQLGRSQEAGLLLRYQSPRDYYALSVKRAGRALVLRLVRNRRGEQEVLAQRPLPGDAGQWRQLTATLQGERIVASVNGAQQFRVADAALGQGRMGLFCEGKGPVLFRRIQAVPPTNDEHTTDPPTPPYAGIIDRHTWASRASSWFPRPEDLDLFWHRGLFAGPVRTRIGVHRDSNGPAASSLVVGDGQGLDSGYRLTASQPAANRPISVKLLRLGKEVKSASAGFRRPDGFVMSLERVSDLVLGRINGQVVISYRDPDPLTDAERVGLRRDAAILDPSDTEVISPDVRTYTFTRAPADWRPLSGTWEVSNRWSCSPQWTWLAGWNPSDEARIRTRRPYDGDQQVDIYVAAKMMPKGNGKHYEELRDLRAGLCGDDQGNGYRFIIGGKDNTYSCIERNGQVVTQNTTYRIPTAGIHNNWLLVTLVKRANVVSVNVWDREILRYEDPEPFEGGYISLGTHHNGIIVPRVSIYALPGEIAPPPPSPGEVEASQTGEGLQLQLP